MPEVGEPVPPLPQVLHIPQAPNANRKPTATADVIREVSSPLSMADALAAKETMKNYDGLDGEDAIYNLEVPPANVDQRLLCMIDSVLEDDHTLLCEDDIYKMGTMAGKSHAKSLEYITRDARGTTRQRNVSSSGSKLECHRRILTWHYCLFRQQHGWSNEERRIERIAKKPPVSKRTTSRRVDYGECDEEEDEEEVEEEGEEEEEEEEEEPEEAQEEPPEKEEKREEPRTASKPAIRTPTPVTAEQEPQPPRQPTPSLLPAPAECSESANNAAAAATVTQETPVVEDKPRETSAEAAANPNISHDDDNNNEGDNSNNNNNNNNTASAPPNKRRRLSTAASRLAFETSTDEILSILGELDPEATHKIQSLESIYQMRRSAVADGIQSLEQLYKMRRATFDEIDRLEDVIEDRDVPETKRERCKKRKAMEQQSLENINQQIVKLEQRTL